MKAIKKSLGFTLLEVLIALSVLVTAIIIVNLAWSTNIFRIKKVRIYDDVSTLLEKKVTELQFKYKDKPLEEIQDEEGDFGTAYPDSKWKLEQQEFNMPDLSGALESRESGIEESLLLIIRQMTELFRKSIKEVRVTVLVKAAGKELKYSVTTYFIDYSKDIPIGPGGAPAAGGN